MRAQAPDAASGAKPDQVGVENYWPWGLSSGDLNADGWQDLFVTASMNYPFRYEVNSAFLNDQGRVFRDSEFILGFEPRRDNRTHTQMIELSCDGEDKGKPWTASVEELPGCTSHGKTSDEALDGIACEDASARPIAGAHAIAEFPRLEAIVGYDHP